MKKSINQKSNIRNYYFFIGTIAELIKILPIITAFKRKGISFTIIASGQNTIRTSDLYQYIEASDIIFLSEGKIQPSPLSLLIWFMKTITRGYFRLKKESIGGKNSVFIVHGDTVSTLMGAILGKITNSTVAHVEAGLRSFNNFQPFPEEITRVIVSQLANIHFCPNEWALTNLKNVRGTKINTKQNTALDTLAFALTQIRDLKPSYSIKKPYFLFVLHRQENLLNKELVETVIEEITNLSTQQPCLCILHAITKAQLKKYNLLEKITSNKRIITVDRLPYLEMIGAIKNADFIITDGGSNQEEAYYLGVPCLLLRSVTERIEGLEQNVVLSHNKPAIIKKFCEEYRLYRQPMIKTKTSPSEIITQYLLQ